MMHVIHIDPISSKDIDDSNEWLMGRMDGSSDEEEDCAFEDDSLTWSTIARVVEVEESVHHTRSAKGTSVKGKAKAKVSSSQSKVSTPLTLTNEEEHIDFEEEYEEEDFGSDQYNVDDDDDDMIDDY